MRALRGTREQHRHHSREKDRLPNEAFSIVCGSSVDSRLIQSCKDRRNLRRLFLIWTMRANKHNHTPGATND